jgi:ankyrin repeat protein
MEAMAFTNAREKAGFLDDKLNSDKGNVPSQTSNNNVSNNAPSFAPPVPPEQLPQAESKSNTAASIPGAPAVPGINQPSQQDSMKQYLIQNQERERVKKEIDKKNFIKSILQLSYKTREVPRAYYDRPSDKENEHLPPIYFESYYTSLAFSAVENDRLDAVRMFVSKYDIKDERDQDGNDILLYATNLGKHQAVRILLAKKLDINIQNNYGLTPLHIAAIKGDYVMAKLLLSMGANFVILDNENKTALDYSEEFGYEDISSMIKEYFYSVVKK